MAERIHQFLQGGGVAGETACAVDWGRTALGPVERWPGSLRTTVGTLLRSRHPMFLWWGPELVQFYNDGYLPSFGAGKHPAAMGQRGADCWQEIWPIIWPQIDDVMRLGRSSLHEDQLVPILRNGRLEEVYWTYGYSPVSDDEQGAVGGTLVVCSETTARVLADRRLRSLRELAEATAAAADVNSVIAAALLVLSDNPRDVCFALTVRPDPGTGQLEVADGATLSEPARSVLLAQVRASAQPGIIGLPDGCPAGPWPEPTREAFIAPIDPENPAGGLHVVGLSPRLPFDAAYRGYLAQVVEHVSQARARLAATRAQGRVENERRNLLRQAPVAAALLTGPLHVFEVANARYCQMVGRTELVGKTYLEAFPELKGSTTVGLLDRVYETGTPFVTDEALVPLDRRGTGVVEDGWFKFNLEPIRDEGGRVYGMMAIAVDITGQVQARLRAEALAGKLQQSEERLRQRADFERHLIGMVSHDLRNPLSAIGLSADVLARTAGLDERAARCVRRIRASADRGSRMIRDLLDFTRGRLGGGIQLHTARTELRQVMLGVLDEVETAHPGREVAVSHQGDARGEWDADRIAQVLQNLVVNALTYGAPGSPVRVTTWVETGWVFLSVQNDGPPIPAERLSRLFEPLERATECEDGAARSIGLGLYIVKQIVTAHGGSIEVRSDAREGTAFTVRLPRA